MAGLFSSGSEGKKIFYKTDEEIERVREACLLVSKTLGHVASILKPGITGRQIDKAAEEFIRATTIFRLPSAFLTTTLLSMEYPGNGNSRKTTSFRWTAESN